MKNKEKSGLFVCNLHDRDKVSETEILSKKTIMEIVKNDLPTKWDILDSNLNILQESIVVRIDTRTGKKSVYPVVQNQSDFDDPFYIDLWGVTKFEEYDLYDFLEEDQKKKFDESEYTLVEDFVEDENIDLEEEVREAVWWDLDELEGCIFWEDAITEHYNWVEDNQD